jgi:hypothetical protein
MHTACPYSKNILQPYRFAGLCVSTGMRIADLSLKLVRFRSGCLLEAVTKLFLLAHIRGTIVRAETCHWHVRMGNHLGSFIARDPSPGSWNTGERARCELRPRKLDFLTLARLAFRCHPMPVIWGFFFLRRVCAVIIGHHSRSRSFT